MRAMGNTNSNYAIPSARGSVAKFRPWVQAAFAAVWMSPFGLRMLQFPSCVFHCYACPLATMACPVGIVAQFASLHLFPLLAVGIVLGVAALVGSLVCGWACPFGFVQDLLARIPVRKFRIPNFLSYGRYIMLIGPVILIPFFLGADNQFFICRLCPAGALEAGVPLMVMQAVRGEVQVWMSTTKWLILGVFLLACVFTYRPWCKVLCPLGGFLSLFNRFSLFHLRFARDKCTECNTCRSRCAVGVQVERSVNNTRCIRCLECTSCGAIVPAVGAGGNDNSKDA